MIALRMTSCAGHIIPDRSTAGLAPRWASIAGVSAEMGDIRYWDTLYGMAYYTPFPATLWSQPSFALRQTATFVLAPAGLRLGMNLARASQNTSPGHHGPWHRTSRSSDVREHRHEKESTYSQSRRPQGKGEGV
ncbi:hypothetical protein BP5796_10396 [Coleophoma crateriformis]|uniref:Uncharacterized protein n=1 Tax=Coleophoma crateriformis TaxID=565419 RepID=A0A3D8QQX7_9HELO|nr:hypothetical protein BP5796_10396 [Coleophoma crateriformis]